MDKRGEEDAQRLRAEAHDRDRRAEAFGANQRPLVHRRHAAFRDRVVEQVRPHATDGRHASHLV